MLGQHGSSEQTFKKICFRSLISSQLSLLDSLPAFFPPLSYRFHLIFFFFHSKEEKSNLQLLLSFISLQYKEFSREKFPKFVRCNHLPYGQDAHKLIFILLLKNKYKMIPNNSSSKKWYDTKEARFQYMLQIILHLNSNLKK